MGGKRWNFFHVSLAEGNSMQNHPSSQDHAGFQQMRAAGIRPPGGSSSSPIAVFLGGLGGPPLPAGWVLGSRFSGPSLILPPNDRDEARRVENAEHETKTESRRRLQHGSVSYTRLLQTDKLGALSQKRRSAYYS
jgi:hypothetical protein